jgi:hypothetical protein
MSSVSILLFTISHVFHLRIFYNLFHFRVNKQREKGKDLSPTGRARDGRALRGRHLQRLHHRRVEKLHEGQITDQEGEVILQTGQGRRHQAQPGESMAGETTNNFDHCLTDHNSSTSITEKNNGLFHINRSPPLIDVSTELGEPKAAGSTWCWARPDL